MKKLKLAPSQQPGKLFIRRYSAIEGLDVFDVYGPSVWIGANLREFCG